jgi:protein-L-isoaspartate(D-aspartate) O-methyltransferase
MSRQRYSLSREDPLASRLEMVRLQIEARGISDPLVLAAMRTVPRHEFVPPDDRSSAYDDRPLPIGWGQTISQPYIVALMTEAAGLRGGESVLEVGTGSGYQSAVLAEIAAAVYSVEILEPLARAAAAALARLAYRNVFVRLGDGAEGWAAVGPFDAILVTAAPAESVPARLFEQLREGGRLVAPVGLGEQTLRLFTKEGARLSARDLAPVRFVPLTGAHGS